MMWDGAWMGGGWIWLWTVLFALLMLLGIVALGLLVVRLMTGGISRGEASGHAHGTSARRILDERFARGELTADEYREHWKVLNGEA